MIAAKCARGNSFGAERSGDNSQMACPNGTPPPIREPSHSYATSASIAINSETSVSHATPSRPLNSPRGVRELPCSAINWKESSVAISKSYYARRSIIRAHQETGRRYENDRLTQPRRRRSLQLSTFNLAVGNNYRDNLESLLPGRLESILFKRLLPCRGFLAAH